MASQKDASSINVLHLSTFDNIGGAARAASRLNNALIRDGVDSSLLVAKKTHKSSEATIKSRCLLPGRLINYINSRPLTKYGHTELESETPFSTAIIGHRVANTKSLLAADIIQLHWINYGFLSLDELYRIAGTKKHVIWTLHDMWAMTGGCHNPLSCRRYEKECGNCELLSSDIDNDISRLVLQKKKTIVDSMNHTVVVPSSWMKSCAERSATFCNSRLVVIPNTIDCVFFNKVSDDEIREKYDFFTSEKLYITFGSHTNASYKGVSYILDALSQVDSSACEREIEIIVFGGIQLGKTSDLASQYTVHNLGRINDDATLRLIYSMADIFISASLQESFGQVLTEAMACETACIAFSNSGSLDIIEHLDTGYLAEYKSARDLAQGIEYYINNEKDRELTKIRSRHKVKNTYDYSIVSKQYRLLYGDICDS